MAKAFDLIHKVAKTQEPVSRIPFEDGNITEDPEPVPTRRPRVEMAFFFILLFIIFTVMGATLVSPTIFSGVKDKLLGTKSTTSPLPSNTPQAGFIVEKDGQSVSEATQQLGVSPTPTVASPAVSPASNPSAATSPEVTQTKGAAKIQVLNGTTTEGAAAAARTKLAKKGIVVQSVGNYKSQTVKKTTIFYRPEYKTAASQIQAVVGGILADTTTGIGSYDILVVIGRTN